MEKLFDKIKSLPRIVQILLVIVLFGLLIYGALYAILPKKETEVQTDFVSQLNTQFPDGTIKEKSESFLSQFQDDNGTRNNSIDNYWNSLENGGSNDGGLVVGNESISSRSEKQGYNGEYLDPTVYSAFEIEQIKRGITSKEAIDEMHRQRDVMLSDIGKKDEVSEQRQREIEDSMYYARMEKTYALAAKYMAPKEEPVPEIPAEPEPRTIELNTDNTLETVEFEENGIIESWDDFETNDSGKGSGFKASPVKATFLKNETVSSGQRVSIRLLQELLLSDGTRIPANTHIKGICEVKDRLNVRIKAINYSGKIYYTDISAYDNDGTEGIYCQTIVSSKSKKIAKNMAKNAVSGAAGIAGTLFGNALVGRVAQDGVNGVSQFLDDDGNLNVAIVSGYEFYVYENVKEKEN